MPTNRASELDLLALAESVATGQRSLDNVIDQIAVATPDDRDRRRAVAELQSLVLGLSGVRAHARATAASRPQFGGGSAARDLVVTPGRVMARRLRFGLGGTLAADASVGVAVVVVAVVLASLRPSASVGGPSPSAGASGGIVASVSPSPTSEPSQMPPTKPPDPAPTGTPVPPATPVPPVEPSLSPAPPVPTAAAGLPPIASTAVAGPAVAFWSLLAADRLDIWLWNPSEGRMREQLTVDTWPGGTIERTVLIAPDGVHIAIHEVNIATNAPVQRIRILTMAGQVVWSAPIPSMVTALAWSPDGTALAIGSLPTPWTVVQLNKGALPAVTTYELDNRDGYALLGFSEDGNTLYGYGTGGEAEFWQKPVALDRARGILHQVDAMPGGLPALSLANSTAPVGQFDRNGRILALAGTAKGDPHWVVRTGSAETPVPVDASVRLTWTAGGRAVALYKSTRLTVDVIDPASGKALAQPHRSLPDGPYRADLVGARDGFALVLLMPMPRAGEPLVATEALMVDLATSEISVGLPPEGAPVSSGMAFAGWVSASN